MEIRYVHNSDVNKINELRKKLNDMHLVLNDIFKDNIDDEIAKDTLEILNSNTSNIICAVTNEVIAYALVTQIYTEETYDRYSKNIYHINELYVDDEYKGKGVGSKLIEFIKQDAKNKGFNRIELDVYTFNTNAIQFYENKGFKEYKRYLGIDI